MAPGDCGCCLGTTAQTPVEIFNRPGLFAIAYRVGTHAQFKASMLAALSGADVPALQDLKTRGDDDLAIGLLDAWAMVADVLTFYQERVANESYLRTATERLSVLHLARCVGYELRPGAAAGGYLAFTLEDAPGAPQRATVPIGTKVQSVPGPGQTPQTFETVEGIEARARWNAMKPRTQWPQPLSLTMAKVFLSGTSTNLRVGDPLLIVADAGGTQTALLRVAAVTPDSVKQQTRVDLQAFVPAAALAAAVPPAAAPISATSAALPVATGSLGPPTIASVISQSPWEQSALQAYALVQGWSIDDLFAAIAAQADEAVPSPIPPTAPGVFALRAHASLFGYNAPDWPAMADKVQSAYIAKWNIPGATYSDWPPWPYIVPPAGQLDLDAVYNKILPASWVAIMRSNLSNGAPVITQVQSTAETADADYTLSSKVTRLTLALSAPGSAVPGTMAEVRQTTVLGQSEYLQPASLPHPPGQADDGAPPLAGLTIELDGLYAGLSVGQSVAVSGERYDLAGVQASEVATIVDISHMITAAGGWTTLTLAQNLQFLYRRDTTTINANLARSTHGETVNEVLGSGDGSQTFQQFTLHQSPLTYVRPPNGSGAQSTLHVSVDDLPWTEVPTLDGHGPRDRVYVTRQTDNGKTTVEFGDGVTGARLPSGQENVRAAYRKGIGREGLIAAGKLSLLMTRPLGIKGVTNPQATSGADDGESLPEGRANAALSVLTMNRIVSLQDYEDFARSYPGIVKAQADWAWDGRRRQVLVTVATADAIPPAPDSPILASLKTAMQDASDPFVPVQVQAYLPVLLELEAGVQVDPAYAAADVATAVEAVLRSTFSVDARSFGQPVSLGEVAATIQDVRGVMGTEITALYFHGDPALPNPILVPPAPQPQTGGTMAPAALLTLDPAPLAGLTVTP